MELTEFLKMAHEETIRSVIPIRWSVTADSGIMTMEFDSAAHRARVEFTLIALERMHPSVLRDTIRRCIYELESLRQTSVMGEWRSPWEHE